MTTEAGSVAALGGPARDGPPDQSALVQLPGPVRRVYDLVAVVVLLGAAYWARRGTLPSDGLWFDDSWVATGAIHGSPRHLLMVGSGHPGFTALLMALHRLGSGSLRELGILSLVAGVLGPAALYGALRVTRFERSIATIVAAALVVAPIPVLYAGRVKGYTLDTVLMVALVVVVPIVARRRWGWALAAGWSLAMLATGSFSGYLLLGSAAATVIVALHPNGDRIARYAAAAVQGTVQLLYLKVAESKTDLQGIEKVMEEAYDGHMQLFLDPRSMFQELMRHLRRVAEVYPGGSGRWLSTFAVVALVGLALGAFRPRNRTEALSCRFLLLAFVTAAAGSLVNRFPFGPINGPTVSVGGRHTLWIVPAFAFGLAVAGGRTRDLIARWPLAPIALDAVIVAAAIALFPLRYEPARPSPFPGSSSSTHFVDTHLGARDIVIVTGTSTFSFANETTFPLHLEATPTHQVGYAPAYRDPRIISIGSWSYRPATPQQVSDALRGRVRAYVLGSGPKAGPSMEEAAALVEAAGFRLVERHVFQWDTVEEWAPPPNLP